MNRRTSIGKNILRMKLRFNWLLEDIYDNICHHYNLTNAGWYPSGKHEEIYQLPSKGVMFETQDDFNAAYDSYQRWKLIQVLKDNRIDTDLVIGVESGIGDKE